MANLELIRWQAWAPDVGNNRELPPHQQLRLELAVGLTKLQLQQLGEARRFEYTPPAEGETPEQAKAREDADEQRLVDVWDKAWGPYVRVQGKHTIGGQEVSNLRSYLSALPTRIGFDVYRELMRLNSMTGQQELFFARSSGGLPTTDGREGA